MLLLWLAFVSSAWAHITLTVPGPGPFIVNTPTTVFWTRTPQDPTTFFVCSIRDGSLVVQNAVEVKSNDISGSMVYVFQRTGRREVVAIADKIGASPPRLGPNSEPFQILDPIATPDTRVVESPFSSSPPADSTLVLPSSVVAGTVAAVTTIIQEQTTITVDAPTTAPANNGSQTAGPPAGTTMAGQLATSDTTSDASPTTQVTSDTVGTGVDQANTNETHNNPVSAAAVASTNHSGVIAGAVIGTLVFLALCLVAFIIFKRRRRRALLAVSEDMNAVDLTSDGHSVEKFTPFTNYSSPMDNTHIYQAPYRDEPSPQPGPSMPLARLRDGDIQEIPPPVPAKRRSSRHKSQINNKRSSTAKPPMPTPERFTALSDAQMEIQEEIHALQAHRIALEFEENGREEALEIKERIESLTRQLQSTPPPRHSRPR